MKELHFHFTREDIIVLGVVSGCIYGFITLSSAGADLRLAYLPTAHDDLHSFYNPYWIRPLFEILNLLPFHLAYALLMVISLSSVVVAVKVFGGRLVHVLGTYQFLSLLFYGQIDALVVLGLALSWWGLEKRRYFILGLGIPLALLKPQITLVAIGVILWWTGSFKARLKSLLPLAGAILFSVWRYGWWFLEWFQRLLAGSTLGRPASITLWEYFGPLVLVLWLPIPFMRLSRRDLLIMILSTSAITMPYYSQYSLIAVQVFPIGWIAWLGNIGFLFYKFHWEILKWVVLLPLMLYIRLLTLGLGTKWVVREES